MWQMQGFWPSSGSLFSENHPRFSYLWANHNCGHRSLCPVGWIYWWLAGGQLVHGRGRKLWQDRAAAQVKMLQNSGGLDTICQRSVHSQENALQWHIPFQGSGEGWWRQCVLVNPASSERVWRARNCEKCWNSDLHSAPPFFRSECSPDLVRRFVHRTSPWPAGP